MSCQGQKSALQVSCYTADNHECLIYRPYRKKMQTVKVQQSARNLKRQLIQMEKMLYKSKPFHTKANVRYNRSLWICRDLQSYNKGGSQLSSDVINLHFVGFYVRQKNSFFKGCFLMVHKVMIKKSTVSSYAICKPMNWNHCQPPEQRAISTAGAAN